eukprot:TRINITY_DN49782_c0_g1_i1.p1 TRINITY_DN49782_c0_g1~~TRINITY_DN49782_c0_g1_i1.p1  ORF type:complete len:266 (-),score=41.66 TRINITY_DN49782_c0_g1_i1:400-1197(-)
MLHSASQSRLRLGLCCRGLSHTQNLRLVSTACQMGEDAAALVPGLVYQPRCLEGHACQALASQARELDAKIRTHRQGAESHTSKAHNLPFEKLYKLIRFEDVPGRILNAQSFVDYGSDGHDLTYFINNENIPSFIHEELVSRISQMSAVKDLRSTMDTSPKWRFTLNVYRKISSQQAGFGWHKDIATNGDITSITTIFGSAVFQIRPEGKDDCTTICSIPLIPGSIVLLSGDSRWKWEHRILPSETSTVQSQDVGRISLVLGCRK